ncbi:ABC transporter permease [Allokutzneria multivorans]|uniref:ABC transporter permease n=1 Tax=Allokutzneria multivorans TaxID=1142134 RepID=A0ABP7QRE9_9PSEU
MSTASVNSPRTKHKPSGLFTTVGSEWTKIWSLGTSRILLLVAVGLAALAAALFVLTSAVTTGTDIAKRDVFDVVSTSLLGSDAAALTLMVMAAMTIGSEYSTGMIRVTLTASPKRSQFLAAKAIVIAVVTYVVGVVAAFVAYGVGQLILLAQGLDIASVADPRILRLILGSAIMAPLYGLIAVAFGIVFRSTAGGILAALVALVIPSIVGWVGEAGNSIMPYLPGEALHNVAGLTAATSPYAINPGVSAIVLVAWVLVVLGIGQSLLAKRDA